VVTVDRKKQELMLNTLGGGKACGKRALGKRELARG
jgi:hypothetical protein